MKGIFTSVPDPECSGSRVFRIRKFLGLPDPLIVGTDPTTFKQNSKKNLYFCVTSLRLFILEDLCRCTFDKYLISKKYKEKTYLCWRLGVLTKWAGSGSVSQRYGSLDPDSYLKCHGTETLFLRKRFVRIFIVICAESWRGRRKSWRWRLRKQPNWATNRYHKLTLPSLMSFFIVLLGPQCSGFGYQSHKLDPVLDPHQFEDYKAKCIEYEPFWELFQGFEPLFGS